MYTKKRFQVFEQKKISAYSFFCEVPIWPDLLSLQLQVAID